MYQDNAAGIIASVCRCYKLASSEIYGESREHRISHPRQLAMYLIKKRLGLTSTEIGLILGGRDHTTVFYGLNAVRNRLKESKTSDKIWRDILRIERRLPKDQNILSLPGYRVRSFALLFNPSLPAKTIKEKPDKPKTRICLAHGCGREFAPKAKHQFMCLRTSCLKRRRDAA